MLALGSSVLVMLGLLPARILLVIFIIFWGGASLPLPVPSIIKVVKQNINKQREARFPLVLSGLRVLAVCPASPPERQQL